MRRVQRYHGHSFRPRCENLELRSLLSGGPSMGTPAMASLGSFHAAGRHHGKNVHAPIITQLSAMPQQSTSTVPANGDVNPYGVAFVPHGFHGGGAIQPGDVLVSNFNNSMNLQGTGTTIVRITPSGQQSLFFQSSAQGLSTALGVFKAGFVLVGNVPTTDGSFATIGQGSLQILDRFGKIVATLSDPKLLDGPWDLTINDHGGTAQVFVSNVLSGTITRVNLSLRPRTDSVHVQSMTQIASGFAIHQDPAALVVGPTGLAFDARRNILYVASTGDNAIFAIRNASSTRADQGMGRLVFTDANHLHGPLGLAQVPNGDLLTTNGDAPTVASSQTLPSALIEFTPHGQFVGELSLDPATGAAFGMATQVNEQGLTVATVNDDTNSLDIRTVGFHG